MQNPSSQTLSGKRATDHDINELFPDEKKVHVLKKTQVSQHNFAMRSQGSKIHQNQMSDLSIHSKSPVERRRDDSFLFEKVADEDRSIAVNSADFDIEKLLYTERQVLQYVELDKENVKL